MNDETQSLMEFLQTHYDLKKCVIDKLIRRGTQGQKFIIHSGEKNILLRIIPSQEMVDLCFALQLQNILAAKYGTSARIVPNLNGKLWTEHNEFIYILEECLKGRSTHLPMGLLGILGKELGYMHKVALEITEEKQEGIGWAKYINRALSLPISEWDAVQYPTVAAFEASAAAAREALEDGMKRRILPLGIHGDVNPTNMLWIKDKMTFCDFANAQVGPQILDLAMAIFGCCILNWDFDTGLEKPLTNIRSNSMRPQALLKGYTQVRPFTNSEIHLIQSAILLAVRIWIPWLKFKSIRVRSKVLSQTNTFSTHIAILLSQQCRKV